MFKPATITAEAVRRPAPPLPADAIAGIFRVLHGYYGNLFTSKYASGQLDDERQDTGIVSARITWAQGLRRFDESTIRTALRVCRERYLEFPPSLPQFLALCAAAAPRQTYRPAVNLLEMGGELRSRYAAQARAINARHREKEREKLTGFRVLPDGLQGLKQAIASAVGAAGGDEAEKLLQLDRLYPQGAAA